LMNRSQSKVVILWQGWLVIRLRLRRALFRTLAPKGID
jgi:hypothetical protein